MREPRVDLEWLMKSLHFSHLLHNPTKLYMVMSVIFNNNNSFDGKNKKRGIVKLGEYKGGVPTKLLQRVVDNTKDYAALMQ